jgi:hypothetical protein
VIAAQVADQPVIWVDTKKKELIGRNGGTDYRPEGDPRRVTVHDFEDKELGKVTVLGSISWFARRRMSSTTRRKAGVHHLTKSFAPEWTPRRARQHRRASLRRNAMNSFALKRDLATSLAQQHAYGEGRPNPRNCFDRVVSRL